jgi:uncharacterized protein
MDLATHLGGALIAFLIAMATVPAGVSGAVLLVPVQISILGVANPAVTPTNLLYNVIATPGAIAGYGRRPSVSWRLAKVLSLGGLPGVLIGAFLRVEFLAGPRAFYGVMAIVLAPIGAYLLARPHRLEATLRAGRDGPVALAAFLVGVIGGIYGIGGGSLLAPVLVAIGYSIAVVAPVALVTTLVTSIAGVAMFVALAADHGGEIAPDWSLGIALGLGGLLGGFVGASLQHLVPESAVRRLLGALSVGLAIHYVLLAV